MIVTCPRCSRKLSDSISGDDAPLFCMYCGHRLASTGDETATLPAHLHMVSPADMATRDVGSDPTEPEQRSEVAPSSVAGYRLLRFIGAGGMGNVFEAVAEVSGQKVAVKLLSRKLASNPTSIERFRQEGRLASQISHPRCVFVLRADTEAGRPFIIMELMPGRTLKDIVDERGPLPVEEAIDRMLDVIDGLIEAHRLGVIHRDVKPSNCFLTEDNRVKVGDFGLSKSLSGSEADKQLTHSGAFLGTVLFASPEQIRGEPVGYDSDVYAVCATLYYLLTARAPHQHDSMTAALAKAISEPPPPVRTKRTDVPPELDRLILRGLDRDRSRRLSSLEELRDALLELLPARQQPARPRAMSLAYIVDSLLLQFLLIPAEVLHQQALRSGAIRVTVFDATWIGLLLSAIYFVLMEGLTGATLGKRLVKLRVCRLGKTGPPGLVSALIRTLTFNAIWLFMFTVPGIFGAWFGGVPAILLGGMAFLLGLGVLFIQLRRTPEGFRGAHDLLAGTRVIQRPRPPGRVRLVSKFPNPLDRMIPPAEPLPALVGGFKVKGKACETGIGGEIWVAEDQSLGRQIIVVVEPPGYVDGDFGDHGVVRPARLRSVGHGRLSWGGGEREWTAYVAPAGAPLADVVSPLAPLGWAEARPVLEQLVAELVAAQSDESLPHVLTAEQIWVEPGGRLQILDFPLPTGQAVAAGETKSRYPAQPTDPVTFVAQVTTLMLEGSPRTTGGPVRAPIPPHASEITNRLFENDSHYSNLDDLRRDLAENHTHPPQVTAGMRAGTLTLQGLLVALGLMAMIVFSGFHTFGRAVAAMQMHRTGERVELTLNDPERLEAFRESYRQELPETSRVRQRLDADLAPERVEETRRLVTERLGLYRTESDLLLGRLNSPEKFLYRKLNEALTTDAPPPLEAADGLILAAKTALPRPTEESTGSLVFASVVVAIWPLVIWPVFAFLFRGGLGMILSGVTLVRANGQPAGRFRCALREILGWLPLWVVFQTVLWLQWSVPEMIFARTFLWFIGLMMLPLSVAIALREPARGPHDHIVGTYLVPR